MGFYPTVCIVKTRRTARLGALALCLDEFEHLGVFLEIERVIPPGRSRPRPAAAGRQHHSGDAHDHDASKVRGSGPSRSPVARPDI